MIHLLILAVHLLATIAKLVRPGGVRAVVAESLLLKHQLVIRSRARRRAPNLNSFDRFLLGLGSLLVPASRILKLAVILKPRTLFRFHEALKKRKYRRLFSSEDHQRLGPKGPSKELIDAIVEIKCRNPRVGCPRIAQEIAHAFGGIRQAWDAHKYLGSSGGLLHSHDPVPKLQQNSYKDLRVLA